MKTMQMKKKN